MKVALAQIRLKIGDNKFNYEQIINQIENTECDLIIFPDIEDIGEKDLLCDEKYIQDRQIIYEKIAQKKYGKSVLIGQVLIKNGKVSISKKGFFNLADKNIYVSDYYTNNVVCDLQIVAKNRYFTKDEFYDFAENIETGNDFIFVNAVALSDYNVYAGASFAKNKNNEFVMSCPLCEGKTSVVDFNNPVKFHKISKEELIYKVLVFALREYCENTGFKKVILGLSGGIDSALVAVLAKEALGSENVLGIMLPSMYSSQGSIDDSLNLAKKVNIGVEKYPITPLFEKFMSEIAKGNDKNLAGENLQARLRGLILMYFSNRDGRLLLSTGNKSELSMGFCTLYGDMAGGINIIADLFKTEVYALVNYINRNEIIIPQEIIDKAPSAELRPNQKDQDRLPEYDVLDDIISNYLAKSFNHEKMYKKYGKELVEDVIKKLYRAQFKRKQACLGIRLSENSFLNGFDIPIVQRYY